MKLLLITLEYPPFHGGVATYLETLVNAAPRDVVVTVDEPPKTEHWFKTAWRLIAKVKKEKYDLVAVSHVLPIGYIAWKLRVFTGTPYLVFTHGTDILTARKNAWKRMLTRFVLRHAKHVIANSHYTAGLLKEEGITATAIITPSVKVKPLHAQSSATEPIPSRRGLTSTVLSVGRLVPRKGFDTMIRALAEVVKIVPDARYVIVGEGPEREALVALSKKLGIEKSVSFVGEVGDTRPYFEDASVFVLPAREVDGNVEGFGIVCIEAASYGLPVVVGRSGGAPETVKDGVTGVVVETPDNVAAYARAVIRLLQNPDEARKMGAAGRNFVEAGFSTKKTSEKFWNLLRSSTSLRQ